MGLMTGKAPSITYRGMDGYFEELLFFILMAGIAKLS